MKIRHLHTLTLTAFAFAAAALAGPGVKPHSHDKQPEWAGVFGGATLPTVWQSLTAAAATAKTALAAGNMDIAADMAETIHLGAHALSDQVKLGDAEKQKRLDAALAQAAKIADELLDAAQHAEAAVASAALGRIEAALALARSRLPNEVTDAPADAPRSAKAPKHGHHGKH